MQQEQAYRDRISAGLAFIDNNIIASIGRIFRHRAQLPVLRTRNDWVDVHSGTL
jgi:hypothetical protein